MESEKQRLENIARDYDNPLSAREISGFEIEYCFEIFKRFYRGGAVLEMGPAEGVMTERLCGFVEELEVLEGSAVFCENLSKRFEGLRVHNALFEEFCPQKSYSAIVMGHVLEHVENPKEILELVKNWLKKGDSLGGGRHYFCCCAKLSLSTPSSSGRNGTFGE